MRCVFLPPSSSYHLLHLLHTTPAVCCVRRISRTPEADAELAKLHSQFADLTVALGGRFYLPYRHHYSQEQLLKAYPEFPQWVAAKQRYDPGCLFSNQWFDKYGLPHWPAGHGSAQTQKVPAHSSVGLALFEQCDAYPEGPPIVSDRRSDSMKKLLSSPLMWNAFRNEFLVNIFHLVDNVQLCALIQQAVMLSRMENGDDFSVFLHLRNLLFPGGSDPSLMTTATKAWNGIKQAHAQREELLRQTQNILGKLGRIGRIDGLVCVGDPGKLVLELQTVCGVRGNAFVVNDTDPDKEVNKPIGAVITRRSCDKVGEFVPFSYAEPLISESVPSESVELVTMNQGLHHLPQTKLLAFLASVRRVLRPGGLFIIREHDAAEYLIPMCDAAHLVFNCVTGVSATEEKAEIRAFRPILEWRKVKSAPQHAAQHFPKQLSDGLDGNLLGAAFQH